MHLIDPSYQSRQVKICVYHDGKSGTPEQDLFLGEAEFELALRQDQATSNQLTVALRQNKSKSRQIVSGTVSVEYSWKPNANPAQGCLIHGQLWFSLTGASGLTKLDWRKSTMPDPYAVIDLHPQGLWDECSKVYKPHKVRTITIENCLDPSWRKDTALDFFWQGSTQSTVENEISEDNFIKNQSPAYRAPIGNGGNSITDASLVLVHEELKKLRENQTIIRKEQTQLRQDLSLQLDSIKSLVQNTGASLRASMAPPPRPPKTPPLDASQSSSKGEIGSGANDATFETVIIPGMVSS